MKIVIFYNEAELSALYECPDYVDLFVKKNYILKKLN